jgi:hypothetical protein
MKTQEEIEQLFKKWCNNVSSSERLAYIDGYTQCQEDMAEKKYTERQLRDAMEGAMVFNKLKQWFNRRMAMLTLAMSNVEKNSLGQQGETLGINQSMQSLAQFIPPILVGFFGENLNVFPFLIGGLSIVLAWVILVFLLIPLMKKQSVF